MPTATPTRTQFNALTTLAQAGLIPGVNNIAVPSSVPVPFRDYMGSLRFDWSQSAKSHWFVRGAMDNYTTYNNLVQQGTLPSTGTTSYSNYMNLVLSNQYTFSPTWLGSFTFDASYLHHTEARNQYLGFAWPFRLPPLPTLSPASRPSATTSFVTPITAFPVLRNQEKYQFKYDVAHATGAHALKFGIDFIHEPVLSGALSGTAETLSVFTQDPTFYVGNPTSSCDELNCYR